MLQANQIIRYNYDLYKVVHVNDCRALISPLLKTKNTLAEAGALSISCNAEVPIITDVEQERDRIELAFAEQELAETRAALVAAEQAERAPKPKAKAAPRPAKASPTTPRGPRGGGWRVTLAEAPFKPGTQGAIVFDYILKNPGQTTAEIVAGVGLEGAIAAAVSRMMQAGIIVKVI